VTPQQLSLLLLVAVLANLALMAAIVLPPALGRALADEPALPLPPEPVDIALQVAAGQGGESPEAKAGLSLATYDRVVRIVSYAFLAGTAVIIWLGGLFPAAAPAIYALLALGALFVLVVHDLLPSSILGPGKFVLEGSAAIAFFTILIALTGGVDSPFFFGYYLIVAGAALVVGGPTTFLLAATTSIVYLVAMAAQPGSDRLTFEQVTRLGFNILALWLLSYLASVLAREQRRTRDAAIRLSLFDPLTQLYNRNYFFAVLEREILRAARTGRSFCLLMLDMDGLKPINDTYGHHYGDKMLREVAEVVRSGIRGIDAPARYGGDEFVVLLPETEPEGGTVLAEKLRQGVSEIRIDADGRELRSTVSVGVVSYPDDGTTGDQLLISADTAMYASKRQGKDRIAKPRPPSARTVPRDRDGAPATAALRPAAAAAPAPPRPAGAAPAPRARPAGAAAPAPPRLAPQPTEDRPPDTPPSGPASGAKRRKASAGAGKKPAATARPAGERATPKQRGRRFQVVQHDDDHQLDRTMSQLLKEPGSPGSRRARAANADGDDEASDRPA
jgi:diguanylate cyclase (GGDEF)-like protein